LLCQKETGGGGYGGKCLRVVRLILFCFTAWNGRRWCYRSLSRTNWRLQLTVNCKLRELILLPINIYRLENEFLQWTINILFHHVYSRCRILSGWHICSVLCYFEIFTNKSGA
jgi:hypothetical protein